MDKANALVHFGQKNQMIVAIEELSECQKEICKLLRGEKDVHALAEEIADAQIVLEQLVAMFGLSRCVESFKAYKLKRLEARCNAQGRKIPDEELVANWAECRNRTECFGCTFFGPHCLMNEMDAEHLLSQLSDAVEENETLRKTIRKLKQENEELKGMTQT